MRTLLLAKCLLVVCLVMLVLSIGGAAWADSLSVPIRIATSTADGATLGIPRWKGYMSPSDPDKFWASFANNGGSSNNLCFTRDGGTTWSTNTITLDGYMNFHLALAGSGDDLFFAFPSTYTTSFRHVRAPAESVLDADPKVNFSGTTANHRASITVQDNGRIWVFTRLGGSAGENVRYKYSDNGGTTWTSGVAFSTGAADVRIGSMPFVNGNPVLVVLHLNDNRGYEYYIWNGTSFQAMADHSIYAFNPGYDRSFSHNQINDSVMHLVFGQGTNLRHVWKNYANGTGAWNTAIIASDAANGSIEWYPITTVRGNELYVFYCRRSSTDNATSRIFYKRWSQATRTWSQEYQVSTQAYSRDPNTCLQVPASSPYIPVTWRSGTGPYNVYFAKVIVDPDTTALPAVYDLTMASLPAFGGTTKPIVGSSPHLDGTRVSVAASASLGYTFSSWTGDVDNPSSPITSVLMNSDKSVTANFTETSDSIGSIHGLIRTGTTGLSGVYVDFINSLGVSFARAISDDYGYYASVNLPADNYRLVVQTPFGFAVTGGAEQNVLVAEREVVRNLDLTIADAGDVVDFWSWKREILAISEGAVGAYGMTRAQIDGYLEAIFNAYHSRTDGHQLSILYVTHTDFPARAMTLDDVLYHWYVLSDESPAWTCRKFLLADLLNIVSARLGQLAPVTADGASSSKALHYLTEKFISGPIDAELAAYISMIHQSQTIPAGVVDLATPNIMYGGFGELTRPPIIDCLPGPIAAQVCGPGHVCVPLAIQDYGQVVVTPAPATWLAGQLCFDFTEIRDYTFHIAVAPEEPGLDPAECDITVALSLTLPPTITGPDGVVELFGCDPGPICIDLPVTNYTTVSIPGATWSANRLCFTVDTSGLYTFVASATNSCATVQRAVSVRVTLGQSVVLACPASPLPVALCAPGQACVDLPISNQTAVTVPGAVWADNRLCFAADTAGRYVLPVTASNVCDTVTCNVPVQVIFTPPVTIACPATPTEVGMCAAGEVCIDLPIANQTQVSVVGGTWLNGRLCFTAATAGTYAPVVTAINACGSATCTVTVNVTVTPLDLFVADADITIAPESPQVGETVTVSAVVHNAASSVTASNVAVRFYDGAPTAGVQIGIDQSIPSLVSGGAATIQTSYVVAGPLPRDIYVVIDPSGLLAECTESNNAGQVTIESTLITAAVTGTVSTTSTGLEGVQVLLTDGTEAVVRQTVTSEVGEYLIADVPSGLYTVAVELPIGFVAVSAGSVPIVLAGSNVIASFTLRNTALSGVIDYYGWKREIAAISAGIVGDYRITRAQITGYLQTIFNAYHDRDELAIRIPHVTYTGSVARAMTLEEVLYQWTVLVDNSSLHLARKHLLADLFNIASLRQSQLAIVTADGATVGQAMRYFADRFEAGTVDAALATNIGRINQRITIPAGVVPLGTPSIVYKVEETPVDAALPSAFVLAQNYPNPFNPTTTIAYGVPANSHVQIEIFNVLGQTVRSLVNEQKGAGRYEVIWDCTDDGGRAVVSGVYFYRIIAGSYTESKKMLLLK